MKPDFTLSRRGILRTGLGFAFAGATPSLFARALDLESANANDRVLVVLELAGGNDGLNTVVPFADDAYYAARRNIAIDADAVLRLDDEVGFHPSLARLHAAYGEGRVAVIEGVGYPNPIRSHFLSTDVWHAGSLDGRRNGTGWIGRLADSAYAGSGDPNAVIALGAKVPFCCEGDNYRAIALGSVGSYRVVGGAKLVDTLDSAVSSNQVSERARNFLQRAYHEARESSDAVAKAVKDYKPAAEYPANNALAGQLRTVVSLLAGGLDTRVFAVQMGGFDTHNNQNQRQNQLFGQLDAALAAFHADLAAHGLSDRVLVLAFSEFGRRVKSNASGGTDHGAAGVMFAVGSKVGGGRFGARPSVTDLDDNGDLRFTTDFRRAYATVLERWLGVAAPTVLGESHAPLDFLA
jgi:uncharacterized protein (DUF1501 family)